MQPVDVVGAVCHRGNEVAVRHPPLQTELRMQQRSSQQPVHMHKTMHQLCKGLKKSHARFMIIVRVACLLEYPVQTYGTPNILQHWRLLRHVGMRRFAPRESNELWWWKDNEGLRIPFK